MATLRLIAQALAAPPSSVPAIKHEPMRDPDKSNGRIEPPIAVARNWEGEPPGEPWHNATRTEPRPPGITHDRLAGRPEQDGPRHSENGMRQARPMDLRLLYPVARALEDREKRERLRLPSGGLVWITADGSPLTDALAAALKRQDLRCQVVRLNQEPIPQPDDSLCGLIILAPREPHGPTFVQDAFRALRAAGPALQQSASRGSAVFVTVSRLDGSFGLTGLASESSPAAGALAGLAKTARHEWQGVDCKALDLDCSIESAEEAALAIVDEIICRGPAEVGLKSGNDRVSVEIEPVSS